MKKTAIILLAFLMIWGVAMASEKPALEKPVLPADINADHNENEPNDTCADANYLTVDDNYNASIDPAGDEDWFEVSYPAGGDVTFETHPGDAYDTKMYLYAGDCETELAYNDDGGTGYYSRIDFTLDPNTTYYLRITGFSGSTQGSYFLTMTLAQPPCEVPENNTCEGALPLGFGTTFTFNNCGATNSYSLPSSGCTGYTSLGEDVTYYVDLVEDQQLTITASTYYDNAIYLLTDCGNLDSCVAGIDEDVIGHVETLVFDAANAPGRYYVVFDAFSPDHMGDWVVSVDGVVASENVRWDGLKSLYR